MILNSLIPLVRFWGRMPKGWSKLFAHFLNNVTGPFNWINALGARMGGRLYHGEVLGKKFDKVYSASLRKLNSVKEGDWPRGMYFPRKWDALFGEYMTLEDVFRYPVIHFRFHVAQISRKYP